MRRELIIDVACDHIRAAILEDGKLCELHCERKKTDEQAESIYLGRIQAIKPSINAAFVDIGMELNAFLPLSDDMHLRCGDMLLVQGLAKQTTDTKGLRISAKLNLAGKWTVLLPHERGVHISKKVKDPEARRALTVLGAQICPSDCGLIIRTASEDVTEQLLEAEVCELYMLWNEIERQAGRMPKPGLVHRRQPLHIRLLRDLQEISKVSINHEKDYKLMLASKESKQIDKDTVIEYYSEQSQLIFDAYSIEAQIDKALRKRIWLPCGGYLVFDFCEAMTVIDVNSGKMLLGKDLEDTALRVNLEAAEEIARQLRLRDIGGIIVVDFIDMKSTEHQKLLAKRMKAAVSSDRTQVSVEELTRLGLMEITRKRIQHPLHKVLQQSCSYCSGAGEILSYEEVACRSLRQVRRMALSGQRGPFIIRCTAPAAQILAGMHAPKHVQVFVSSLSGRHSEKYEIEQIGAGMPLPRDMQALESED